MKELNSSEISQVSGGGLWDDFWQGVGEWMAEVAFSKHNRAIGKANPEDVRAENPNDPLL